MSLFSKAPPAMQAGDILGHVEQKQSTTVSLDTLLENLSFFGRTVSNIQVTPENCTQAPTITAIINAVSRRISISSLQVKRQTEVNGRMNNELLPDHPLQRLFNRPNEIQSDMEFFLDAVSTLLRYGNFLAEKGQGREGPVRRLVPIKPDRVEVDAQRMNATGRLVYNVTDNNGAQRPVSAADMVHVRLPAKNYVWGDSPIMEVRETIALEIAAEKFGAEFFGNGAFPFVYFEYFEKMAEMRTDEQKQAFLEAFKANYGQGNRFSAMLLPKGLTMNTQEQIDNDKAQFLDTRRHQRTVIAGAFGVPPHFVGDLERSTFNNVEQQDKDFVINVVLPIARMFESALERDLLTADDRESNVVIRFNLDEVNRADFKTRQEGLARQRQNGVISANEWREKEGMNPISEEDGGEDYLQPVNMIVSGDDEPTGDTNVSRLPTGTARSQGA